MDSFSSKIVKLKGTPFQCGQAYGERLCDQIHGFYQREIVKPLPSHSLVDGCLEASQKHAPFALSFLKGLSRSLAVPLEKVFLLSLHEELVHWRLAHSEPHCTVIVVPESRSTTAGAVVGQNWDWSASYLALDGLLKISSANTPDILAYHYPGLFTCAGINSAGLALLWSGAGYLPPIKPHKGVPTYLIITELLRRTNVKEALRLLAKMPRAGSFIFCLGDAAGNTALIEATPGKLALRQNSFRYRANLFGLPEIIKASKQLAPNRKSAHSVGRMAALDEYFEAKNKRVSVKSVKDALNLEDVYVRQKLGGVTVAQLIALCGQRRLLIRRGGYRPEKQRWETVSL